MIVFCSRGFRSIKEAFFDLGEGKTCAMIFGFAQQDRTGKTENIILLVSIFTLALKDKEFNVAAYESAKGYERRFLDVRVSSSHVYTMKENLEDMSSMVKRREAMDCHVDIQQDVVIQTENSQVLD
ncbi:hypothetical protein PIB30_049173 [Stylosanthes scabra]|uniref:Kinesin motor domain-containing protein n=1 Tax=Stylosanthes scabra TaxID=79078 RepID=A0ABU6SH56_9FABA|nr:hypothetical protein [Stylosanthes scabra]